MSKITFQMEILNPDLLEQLDRFIEQTANPKEGIISILHYAQSLFGYLPKELQLYIARKTDLPTAKVNGIVSFYSFFREEPSGKYTISVCMGTACFVRGAGDVLEAFRKELQPDRTTKMTQDGLFSLVDVRCIGACGLAPVVRINDKIFGHVKVEDVPRIIEQYRKLDAEQEASS